MNEAPYTVERRLGLSWIFFSAWATYEDARTSVDRLLATGSWSVRIRRNNELIYTNEYDRRIPVSQDPQTQAQVGAIVTLREDERLAEWRKRHIG